MLLNDIKSTIANLFPIGQKIKKDMHMGANAKMIDELYYSEWGILKPFLGETAPEGYVLCNIPNQKVSKTDCHPSFVSVMNLLYSDGDFIRIPFIPAGSSLIQCGQVLAAQAETGTIVLPEYELGVAGGKINHILTVEEMPSHDHEIYTEGGDDSDDYEGELGGEQTGRRTGKTGGGKSHNNMPPYFPVNYILRIA